MPVVPHQSFPMPGGASVDLYLLRYDKDGRLQSPRTQAAFEAAAAGATDVFVFSHGWNNTFDVALDRYRSFITGYMKQRTTYDLPLPAGYRPILLGVIWPSTSFVWPWESGPKIAGGGAGSGDGAGSADRAGEGSPPDADALLTEEMVRLVGDELDPAARMALLEIIDGRDALDAEDARAAAAIVASVVSGEDPEPGTAAPTADRLVDTWQQMSGSIAPVAAEDDFGTVSGSPSGGPAGSASGLHGDPAIAGLSFDPRDLLRTATVWLMKDRAGKVGARGVGPLLSRLLVRPTGPRVHLIGHSFGARVVLSATSAMPPPGRPAHSMLLLQGAVNRWCFADDVAGTGRAGGYRDVPARVDLPVITTVSSFDVPLTKAFHLALRGGDLGEPNIAALGNTDLYGALGGYGPAGLGSLAVKVPAATPGSGSYPLAGASRVVVMDGSVMTPGGTSGQRPAIGGHGDVSNPATWWALHQLTAP